jgi:hypothetical protein
MYAFYVARGHKLNDLISLCPLEKTFMHCAKEKYYEDESKKYKALLG